MRLKTLLLGILALLLFSTTYAQDKIYKRDGDVINAKVKEVGTKNIVYVRFDSQDGPTYTITKNDVEKIEYQNGTKDEFEEAEAEPARRMGPPSPFSHVSKSKINYKNDILAIAPFQVTENGIGVGVSYERMLDKMGIVSFYLPLMVTFNTNNIDNNGNPNNPGSPNNPMFYAMPGIKFYPTGSHGKVKYAIGPSLVLGSGQQTNYDNYNYNTGTYSNLTQQHFIFGMMVQNSLNINPTPKLYLGLELGLGGSYQNRLDGVEQGITGLVQFAFKVGFRF